MAAAETGEFIGRPLKVGVEPSGSTPERMVRVIADDKADWNAVKNAAMK